MYEIKYIETEDGFRAEGTGNEIAASGGGKTKEEALANLKSISNRILYDKDLSKMVSDESKEFATWINLQ